MSEVHKILPVAEPAPGNEHEALGVVDRIHDPVVAHPDLEVVTSGELRRATRTRVGCEPVNRSLDPVANGTTEPAKRSHGVQSADSRVHPDF